MDENMRTLMARLEELVRNVHQYVGARYVPNFIDDPWSDINEYEAMDVVNNGSGTSYIAKKPVPVGTPLSDRNYWFVYGATSGAIINLQNQIDSIVNRIDNIPYYSPKEYGAAGDGVTDDTQALQDCIDNNDYVIIDGTFLINNTITLHSGLHIIGKGFIKNTGNFDSLYGEDVTNINIDDIGFINGPRDGVLHQDANIKFLRATNISIHGIIDDTSNKQSSIWMDYVTLFDISDCLFNKSGYCAIMGHGNCHYGIIHDNVVNVDNYTGYPNSYGIALSFTPLDPTTPITDRSNQCTNIIIDNNEVYTSYGFWEGIDTHAGEHISITNNRVSGFYNGISLTYGNYSSIDVSPKDCLVANNNVKGAVVLDGARNNMYGILCVGSSASGECHNIIKDNYISEMKYTVSNIDIGEGIHVSGYANHVINNTFDKNVPVCISLNSVGRCMVEGNQAINTHGIFVDFNGFVNPTYIYNNHAARVQNFYHITDATGVSNVFRENNTLRNGYWMNDEYDVTDVSVFVPDYCKTSPVGSDYHPLNSVAKIAIPTANQPSGWIANGSTWLAMANLS